MKHFLIAITMLLCFQMAIAQNQITGKITDETGEGIPGVTVLVKGTTTGTITDLEGVYAIIVEESANTFIVSSIGYKTVEIAIKGRTSIDITLTTDIHGLDEVVVVVNDLSTAE